MVIGWDIGGVNTKVSRVAGGEVLAVRARPFELQRKPAELSALLRDLAAETGMQSADAHAVTMTAELSQTFRTKREGVAFVLDAIEAAFPRAAIRVFTTAGRFVDTGAARRDPIAVAAANWAATAHLVASTHREVLLIDVGTTTTDIIPIVAGAIAASGRTDPERLASGELVYTGALRTPVEAIASHVPLGDAMPGVSAEGFALSGDVHVWRGDLAPDDYTCPTPDGRPATRMFAGERLARVVCGDRELLSERAVTRIADALAAAQVERIRAAVATLARRHGLHRAVVTGLGAFVAADAARAAGLDVIPLATELGEAAARYAPAACVALLLDRERGVPDAVIKIGGSLLAWRVHLQNALTVVREVAAEYRVVIVPGGGPFADAVRDLDEQVGLPGEAAHWMAVLAMDQYAHVLAAGLSGAAIVRHRDEIAAAFTGRQVPVLAPSDWLRSADPLPHSWGVTSDSIAAWIAGQLNAPRLILIKPPGVDTLSAVDAYFTSALPPAVVAAVLPVDRVESLRSMLPPIRAAAPQP